MLYYYENIDPHHIKLNITMINIFGNIILL